MSNKFYTSDLHFDHERIIELAYRPFKTVAEMNTTLITNWNERVTKSDIVYIIGDFTLSNTARYKEIAEQLNGQKYLVLGNHDRPHPEGFVGISQYHTTKDKAFGQKYNIVMFHWAIEHWQGRMEKDNPDKPVIHLHGHSHGLSNVIENRFDVGMDCWEYMPVTLEEIISGGRLCDKKKLFNSLNIWCCWQYNIMVRDNFPPVDIYNVCRKCIYCRGELI